jgi:hypothetical protein
VCVCVWLPELDWLHVALDPPFKLTLYSRPRLREAVRVSTGISKKKTGGM